MKARLFLAAAALALASAVSPAGACAFHSSHVKSSSACPAGQVWDGAAQSCVIQESS
jgi:hypothetical protein